MEIFHAIILGIIEGLTEFLPISSTGHLIISQRLLNYKDTAELFTVVIQLGAIAAVVWHYRQDLIGKTTGLLKGEKRSIKFWQIWVLATIPAAVAGLLFNDALSEFTTPKMVAIMFIVGGILMWLIETYHKAKPSVHEPQLEKLSFKQTLQVGCYQMLALVPGVSRSGATIMGGLLSGLDRVTATAFSFYLSIPILVLAGAYKLVKDGDKISQITGGMTGLVVGIISAFITALFVIKWLLHYIAKHDFKVFAYYRIIAGLVVLVSLALF